MKRIAAMLGALSLAFPLAGCSDTTGTYSSLLETHAHEVEAFEAALAGAETYAPSCRDFAGNQECSALDAVIGEAKDSGVRTELEEVEAPEEADVEAVRQETEKVVAIREKLEAATKRVASTIDSRLSMAFPRLLDESTAKVELAETRVDELDGEVVDSGTLDAVREAAVALREGCSRLNRELPAGVDGMAAYGELMRLKGALDGALSNADNSHSDWQADESRRIQEDAKKKDTDGEMVIVEESRPVSVGDGRASLSGTVRAMDSCEDPDLGDFAYLLHLDRPMSFSASAPWADGELEKTVEVVELDATDPASEPCGPFAPWDGFEGQEVTVEGLLVTDPGARHADIIFDNSTQVIED